MVNLPATNPPLPPLIWPDGRRMVRHELVREVAGPMMGSVRTIMSDHPENGLTPERLARLLRDSEEGDAVAYLELAEAMEEKDLHYLGVLGTRKRAISQLPIEVEPAGNSAEEKADADFISDWLTRDTLESELFDILDAIGKGFSATEIIWELSARQWVPAKLKWRDPRWFEFDRVDGETLHKRTNQGPQPLTAAKYIVHLHPAKSGLPIRGGLARAATWGYLFKNYGVKDWVAFLDAYGSPLRVGRYDNGAAEKDIRFLMNAVAQIGTDAAAVFPKSMDIEFIDGKAGTAPNDLWKSLAEYIDLQVSKAVLGQTATTDAVAGGLGSGQSTVHNEVRRDIERADAKLLAATLNRDLVAPMIILNRGERGKYPRLKIGRPDEEDVEQLTKAARALVPLGVEVGADQIRERAGLPAPRAGEKVLSAPVEMAPETLPEDESGGIGRAPASTALLGPLKAPRRAKERASETSVAASAGVGASKPDPVDDLADEYLGDWERQLTPAIAAVEELLASAPNVDAVHAGLAELADSLDVADLTEALARAAFTARLAGGADIEAGLRQEKD